MPKPKLITKSVPLTVHLPGDLAARLKLYLLSPSLGRIPQGAYQNFFVARTEEFFKTLQSPPETPKALVDEIRAEAAHKHFGVTE